MTENLAALRPRYGDAIGTVKGGGVVFTQAFEKFLDALIRNTSNSQEEPGAVFIPSVSQILSLIDQELTSATADLRTQRRLSSLSSEVDSLKALLITERQKNRALEAKLNSFIAEVRTNG